MEKRTNLCDGWQLTVAENKPWREKGFHPQTVAEIRKSDFLTVPATVPGNFELDLYAAGVIPDPYWSTNMLDLQKYENCHLFYTLVFDAPEKAEAGTERFLHFDGIDTVADLFLNGRLLAHNDNMMVPLDLSCPTLQDRGNELIVHIFPTCLEARKAEQKALHKAEVNNYESLYIRKPTYMFGWDIMPRAVSGGLWRGVWIADRPIERLEQVYLYTRKIDLEKQHADLSLFWTIHTEEDDLHALTVRLEASCGETEFHFTFPCWFTGGTERFDVDGARFWWPKNAGEQNLYRVRVSLWRGDEILDETFFNFGIRTVKLDRTSIVDEEGNGEFCFYVNGKKIFCLGTNWVPLDSYPSRFAERMQQGLDLLEDVGVNMVRLWGGNLYEDDAIFDFCDAHGILIWHDFCMAGEVYPQDDAFCSAFAKEAAWEIRRVRQHTSIALWCGDNECDDAHFWAGCGLDPNDNRVTREILPRVVRDEDPIRRLLPSSPYRDREAIRLWKPTPENHLWGPRDYFKGDFYSQEIYHFASETGYHGCPAPDTLARVIRPEQLWPIFDDAGKIRPDWLVRSTCCMLENDPCAGRLPLMIAQVKTMFGEMPETLERFAKLSQISQAEALKFFIERFRYAKWRRTGIIWWNLLDGCPMASEAVVDYYFKKKLAYRFIQRSQASVCLMFGEPEQPSGRQTLYAVNDTPAEVKLSYLVTDAMSDLVLAQGDVTVTGDSSVAVDALIPPEKTDFLRITWTGDAAGMNHFSRITKDANADRYLAFIKKIGLDTFEGF